MDEELAQLLTPSTFSLEECRAKSRAARTDRERERILLGERLVMQARAARTKQQQEGKTASYNSSSVVSTAYSDDQMQVGDTTLQSIKRDWTAAQKSKIETGKRAAQSLRADAALRRSVRDSWARSSAASEAGSFTGFSFGKTTRKSLGSEHQHQLKLDFSSLRKITERYDMAMIDSARSMASSADVAVSSHSVCQTQSAVTASQQ